MSTPAVVAQDAGGPWHAGERALHARSGQEERMQALGDRVLRSHLIEQHRLFFPLLPFLAAGSVDEGGQPWASLLVAAPGFAHALDEHHLRVQARPLEGDALAATLRAGAPLGLLGIELPTRRRNRLNGWVHEADAQGFTLAVGQSFGNCPRYIQARDTRFTGAPWQGPGLVRREGGLDDAAQRVVRNAGTLFIASAHPDALHAGASAAQGVDVSHRGGPEGFVKVQGSGHAASLLMPDFDGNGFFNTLGNLAINPRAGLLFIDFERGDLLQLAVRTELVWEGPELAAFPGALRALRMHVTQVRHAPGALPLAFGPAHRSPHLQGLGPWADADADADA